MFHESSQTVSLTLNGGIRRHQEAEWTSYCLRAWEIWSWRYSCNSLRSVATWWTASDTTDLRDTSSLGWNPLLARKGDHGCRVWSIVVCKLSQGKEVDPIILLVVDIHLKTLFQDLVDLFGLTVSLRVVGSWEVGLYSQQLAEWPPKLRDEVLETMSVRVLCSVKTWDKKIWARSSASISRR